MKKKAPVAKKKIIKKSKTKKVLGKKKVATKKKIQVNKINPIIPPTPSPFYVMLELFDGVHEAHGTSVSDCLDKIRPGVIKSKGVFVIESGGKKSRIVMRPFEIRQLLLKKISKEIFEKRMLSILK